MLRIGNLTDYAMLIMSQMAKAPDSLLSAATLADKLHLPGTTVSKVLKMLSDAGLLTSVRGPDGGYRLAREASAISVVDVIAAMEGELALTVCCEATRRCTLDTSCTTRENWRKINKMIHSFLSGLSIADMATPLSLQALAHVQ